LLTDKQTDKQKPAKT